MLTLVYIYLSQTRFSHMIFAHEVVSWNWTFFIVSLYLWTNNQKFKTL